MASELRDSHRYPTPSCPSCWRVGVYLAHQGNPDSGCSQDSWLRLLLHKPWMGESCVTDTHTRPMKVRRVPEPRFLTCGHFLAVRYQTG